MICPNCKTNKVDGRTNIKNRYGQTICQSCKDSEKAQLQLIKKHDEEIMAKIEAIVSEVVTEESISEISTRIHDSPFHQVITKLIAYEFISSGYGVSFKDNKISANILDAFVLSKDFKGSSIGFGGSDVMFRIIRRIERNWNLKA